MTSTSDGLAAALAVWPLDREQRSLVREATAGIDERQARALRTLLLEAESAVITCANLLRADAQSQQRPYGRQQPTREERRSERRPGRDLAKTTARKAADDELLKMTTEVVAGYVGNNALPPYQLPELVSLVYSSLRALGGEAAEASAEPI